MKKNEYQARRRAKNDEMRKARKQEKENGLIDTRRLAFLLYLMNSLGFTYVRLSKGIGCTSQNIHWIFSVRDDCMLSMVEKIAKAMGLSISVRLKKETQDPQRTVNFRDSNTASSLIIAEGILPQGIILCGHLAQEVLNCPESSRLFFLANYLKSLGCGLRELERHCGYGRGTLTKVFRSNDIYVSKIYEIARATGAKIEWTVDKA